MAGRSKLGKQGKGTYRLAKLGKAYVLFYGDKKMTVPPAIHNNGLLELHDTIVTTEDGEAYEIKERNGQITFEEIPTVRILKAETKMKSVSGASKQTSGTDGTGHLDELEAGSDESRVPMLKTIRVRMITLTGATHILYLKEDSTIEQLYQKANEPTGVPVAQMRLQFDGTKLLSRNIRKKTMMLSDYNIQDNVLIELTVRLSGE